MPPASEDSQFGIPHGRRYSCHNLHALSSQVFNVYVNKPSDTTSSAHVNTGRGDHGCEVREESLDADKINKHISTSCGLTALLHSLEATPCPFSERFSDDLDSSLHLLLSL